MKFLVQSLPFVPTAMGIATILSLAIAPPSSGQSLGTNCFGTIRGNSAVNLRSGPGTQFSIVDRVNPSSTVILLNDANERWEPNPLTHTDGQGNQWHMVTKSRSGQGEIVPPNRRAWIREDLMSISCPP
ncbi:MAG: hypothetical protein ACAF42_01215 [Limnothrix sp. BL-A-16]